MITAFLGTYDDTFQGGLRGNGKTMCMTYYLYKDYKMKRTIYTNYYTKFSKQMTTKEMTDLILTGDLKNISIGIDEIQVILNSIGTKGDTLKFIDLLISQSRKRSVDILYTSQRFMNVHVRIRKQTDIVIEPLKRHYTENEDSFTLQEICNIDSCQKPHIIEVNSRIPLKLEPINYILAHKVGKLYNSDEIILEKFEVKKK